MASFEIFENNGGMLTLFLLGADGKPVAGFRGWEDRSGSLREAIDGLKADSDSWRDWSGYGEIEESDLENCYREAVDTDALIAWCEGEKVIYCEFDKMGYAAQDALQPREKNLSLYYAGDNATTYIVMVSFDTPDRYLVCDWAIGESDVEEFSKRWQEERENIRSMTYDEITALPWVNGDEWVGMDDKFLPAFNWYKQI